MPKTTTEFSIVTSDELAELFGVSTVTVNWWARRFPDFPVLRRLPGRNLFDRDAVIAWIDNYVRPARSHKGKPRIRKKEKEAEEVSYA